MSEEQPAHPIPTFSGRLKLWVRSFGPWLLAAALIVWISGRVSWVEAWQAAARADLGTFAVALGVAVIYWFLLDS